MSIVLVPEESPERKEGRSVSKKRLTDRVNRLNFLDKAIIILFSHPKYGHKITVTADPLPCNGEIFEVRWREGLPDNISQYKITSIVLPGAPEALSFTAENPTLSAAGLCCSLPPQGVSLFERQFSRVQVPAGIKATISQHSICFEGILSDFSAHTLCVKIKIDKPNSRYWITPERPVQLTLETQHEVIFSGGMKIIRSRLSPDNLLFVLEPLELNTPRFETKHYRSVRMCLIPEPSLALLHPLTGRRVELNVVNLSGLGMCVEELPAQAMLLPGMILPKMHLQLGAVAIPCKGQVVYRAEPTDNTRQARCGIALLEIETMNHLRLLSMLQRARNRNAHLSAVVDVESLWEFLFETGFIYPSKYLQLAKRKEDFKETLQKTYTEQTSISRHFTFQADGQIQAHLSAVRLYERTWFKQHHAAKRSGKHAVGFEVILQLAEYFYNAFSLSNEKIGYIAGIYRPENRFPTRCFSGAVKHLKNQKAASLDLFAYFNFIPEIKDQWAWPDIQVEWQLVQTTKGDLVELNGFYEQVSGGCMTDALDLKPEMLGRKVVEEEYQALGMTRRRHLYSIKREQELMAVIELHESNTSLSLSRMDQVVLCYVLDDALPSTQLKVMLKSLSTKFNLDNPPLMIYPQDYASSHGLKADKKYQMMILNMLHIEEYMHFLNNLTTPRSSD
ncbi:hypothetical protein [Geopsychrobacter electrodiphilus]|uniref:hypothetical protein n=1 Tax=Geopsychrobacter electrodiphilus TaxID=225196 RepID=UPI0003702C71|nr:hypothetical protein [Geopsychrobacter electrodiphilus]